MFLKIRNIAIILATICIAFSSCSKSELNTICDSQEIAIEAYINKTPEKPAVINNGSYRVIETEGFGATAQSNSSVKISYMGYIFSNGIGQKFADETTTNITLGSKEIIEGLENGIVGMKEGESAYILFSARHGFFNKPIGTIPSMSALIYYVTLQKIN